MILFSVRVGGNTADFINETDHQAITPSRAELLTAAANRVPGLKFSLQLNWPAGVDHQIAQVGIHLIHK
jgi:hypothetical protein